MRKGYLHHNCWGQTQHTNHGNIQAQETEKEKNAALRQLLKKWIQKNPHNCVITGDFNEISSNRDVTSTYLQKPRKKRELHRCLQRMGMVDSLRQIEPTDIRHTHVQNTTAGKCFSRLDYVYIANDFAQTLTKYDTIYHSRVTSNHFAIWIMLDIHANQIEVDPEDWKIDVRSTNKKNGFHVTAGWWKSHKD